MAYVKNILTIKDLENLSGIKAHTIRIWEKRYNVLEPKRTDTNIRYYDLASLQKLLNITLLHNHGYKISKISKYPEERIPELVNEIISSKSVKVHAISDFKLAMMNFDQTLFVQTYNKLLSEKPFREIFHEIFVPLLNEIGLLWQTDTINIVHEHFISHQIKQKVLVNSEKAQLNSPQYTDRTYVLYLPMNEIHELGILFVNYEIINAGFQTVYLGESVPLECLSDMKKAFSNITYVTYCTVEPIAEEMNTYVKDLKENLLNDDSTKIVLLGKQAQLVSDKLLDSRVTVYESINTFIRTL
ncbi:MerR family transcriptional regulator [Flavobacterium aurantiibacter]|uniref:MerR family transcriptional regulator n=1 Tax=Flavobacterium aurantiibacter TaxID=2023067 RepID=A0A255ZIX6_9FLAO|nr:MerR family transcriptional regulator [Flavobacterium aurantiibacter]OYQ40570.1 MerR family transcriptional regulator [Flavobacterium aurantiibacter]